MKCLFGLIAAGCLAVEAHVNIHAELYGHHERVLTNAAQIRALSFDEAAQHLTVRLRGVVVLASGGDSAVLADGTACIYLQETNGMLSRIKDGDSLSVTGVADPGNFAPIVIVTSATRTGTEDIPAPQKIDYPELQTGRFDAQWVEVSGTVRRSQPFLEDSNSWSLLISYGGGLLPVSLSAAQGRLIAVDSEVRLCGICFYQFNQARQMVRPVLQIPSGEAVLVTRPAPADPFAVPKRPISSLLQFSTEDLYTHRVRVSGVVTYAVMGEGFWIRSNGEGLHVESSQNGLLAVGDRVDVLGFLSRGGYSPMLEDAIFRKEGKAGKPAPIKLTNPRLALDHDGDLVQLDGQILEIWHAFDGCRLTLKAVRDRFPALLRLEGYMQIPRKWQPDSRVRVVGICSVKAGQKEASAAGTVDPGAFQILLRSPSDITVLQPPPWWTPEHVGWIAACFLGVLLIVGGVVFRIHRLRVARQLAFVKSQAALASERTRIARDLHDEIGANLTHISILSTLASASNELQGSKKHCMEAANSARQTIRAFDEILWSVNPKNDTLHSLSDYICRYAEEVLAPAMIAYHFELDESFPNLPLPPRCRHDLLLAVKETINNVIKHASAKLVKIKCNMETDRVFSVCVADNGCGLSENVEEVKSHQPKGMGLENLRRRMKEMGGECLIESQPGKGTQVTFRLPL